MADSGQFRRHLPPDFVRANVQHTDWMRGLPDLTAQLAERWELTLEPPFPAIRLNYVAPATRRSGQRCVLKVSPYLDDCPHEIAAIKLWNGDAAALLLESDPVAGALLVERVDPGTMLVKVALQDDDAATLITADLLRRLWRPAPPASGLRPLESWFRAYDTNRDALGRGERGFPTDLFRHADDLRRDLLASTADPVVLHGDMHHYNVLKASRAPWLAIDPKGLAGDRYFDVCQFLRNPGPVPRAVNQRRLDILCGELGLDRQRTKDWCFAHAMLDACWSFEDGASWDATVAYARETLEF